MISHILPSRHFNPTIPSTSVIPLQSEMTCHDPNVFTGIPVSNSAFSAHSALPSLSSPISLSIDVPEFHPDSGPISPTSACSEMLLTPPSQWQIRQQRQDMPVRIATDLSSETFEDVFNMPPKQMNWVPDDSCQTSFPASQQHPSNDLYGYLPPWEGIHERLNQMDVQGPSLLQFPYHDDSFMLEDITQSYPAEFPSDTQTYNSLSYPNSQFYKHIPIQNIPPTMSAQRPASFPIQTATQPPIKLHQPRPSRRIPIISLSELASACDGDSMAANRNPGANPDVLSPLPLDLDQPDHFRHYTKTEASNRFPNWQRKSDIHPHTTTESYREGMPAKVILCSCGCRESYTIP